MLQEQMKSMSECLAGLSPILEGLRNEVKQQRIDYAGFVATTRTTDENLERRIDKVENVNQVWNVINTLGAAIAGVLGIRMG
jgi:hypothetical protein